MSRSLALETTAAILSDQCPYASDWPNCQMNTEAFSSFTSPLQTMSSYQAISFSPILKSTEIAQYEAFSSDFWDSSGYGHLNLSDHIVARSSEGTKYQEVDSSSAKGKYDILVPVFQISPLESNTGAVLFNIYSETNRATTIDYAIDTPSDSSLPATGISEFIYLVQDDEENPASLIMHPIVPLHNTSTVGLAVGVLR
jgi:CHASE1-domain containing sensor protein